jgi:altronate hydrolase
MKNLLHLNKKDNVVCALRPFNPGQKVNIEGVEVKILSSITVGHKMAISKRQKGEPIIKYGYIIGYASKEIKIGEHVHIQNVDDPVSDWKKQNPLLVREEGKTKWNLRDIKEKMEE